MILHRAMGRNLQNIPFHKFHFHLVLLIPYATSAKTIFVRTLIIHYFEIVNRLTLNNDENKNDALLNKNLQVIFSFAKLQENYFKVSLQNPKYVKNKGSDEDYFSDC